MAGTRAWRVTVGCAYGADTSFVWAGNHPMDLIHKVEQARNSMGAKHFVELRDARGGVLYVDPDAVTTVFMESVSLDDASKTPRADDGEARP